MRIASRGPPVGGSPRLRIYFEAITKHSCAAQAMNNHTLFFSDLTTLLLYAAGLGLLSLSNPRFRALRWFFATELLFVVKTVLQGLKGSVPNFFSYFLANVL